MKMNKKGSALLIVLGFLSFMVVSAVAFAIFMRSERMPSSAVRRAITTRHLVKAALAEAISRVDDAIRDDPFPGLCAVSPDGIVNDNALFYHFNGNNQSIDMWKGRVFMPPAPQGGTSNAKNRSAPVTETVSVLNLEALGYLPPDLVNDVRFLSRSSWAASWHTFPFDAGRFAYCAVNVSDYLDIHRAKASQPRSSEASRRLSVAHLFDVDFDPTDADKAKKSSAAFKGAKVENPDMNVAKAFDKITGTPHDNSQQWYGAGFIAGQSGGNEDDGEWDNVQASVPYVSMMDYNLAMANDNALKGYLFPLYYNWLDPGVSKAEYYKDGSFGYRETQENDARWGAGKEISQALRQPFVTESCSTNEKWTVDLAKIEDQPFNRNLLENEKMSYATMAPQARSRNFFNALFGKQHLGFADIISLRDYLDYDNIPLSLAFPCVERTPMIVGLTPPQFTMGNNFQNQSTTADKVTTTKWKFNPQSWFGGANSMQLLVSYPFKRQQKNGPAPSYEAQVLMRIVLAPHDVDYFKLAEKLRPDEDNELWKDSKIGRKMEDGQFVFTCLSRKLQVTVPDDVVYDTDACAGNDGRINITFDDFGSLNMQSDCEVFQKKSEEITVQDASGFNRKQTVDKYTVFVTPYNKVGDPMFPVGTEIESAQFDAAAAVNCVPHVFMWARIIDTGITLKAGEIGTTVDLVPAGVYDDKLLLDRDTAMMMDFDDLSGQDLPIARPVFHFGNQDDPANAFSFSKVREDSFPGCTANWTVKSVYAVDPRFNYAPEQWYATQDTTISFDKWLTNTKDAMKNHADRDQDIFMFVSNQGVLQSIGEFAFLPYLHDSGTGSKYDPALGRVSPEGKGVFGADAGTVMKNFNCLWRTYDSDDFYERAAEADVGIARHKENLVNPHTDNLSVMMAALANTPYDYWAAAAGADENLSPVFKELANPDSPQFATFDDAKRYAFNETASSGLAMLKYTELVDISKTIMCAMGGLNVNSDDTAYQRINNMNLCDNQKTISERPNLRGGIATILKEMIRNGDPANNYIKARPSNAWQIIWRDLWSNLAFGKMVADDENTFKQFMGVTLQEPLHGVDRKYLYSYWRDCFANNQQLFLIFVRAESGALGGPGEGTPSQQGGRAVALVWRDPDWTEGNGDPGFERDKMSENEGNANTSRPHRTRVLFYHQFD